MTKHRKPTGKPKRVKRDKSFVHVYANPIHVERMEHEDKEAYHIRLRLNRTKLASWMGKTGYLGLNSKSKELSEAGIFMSRKYPCGSLALNDGGGQSTQRKDRRFYGKFSPVLGMSRAMEIRIARAYKLLLTDNPAHGKLRIAQRFNISLSTVQYLYDKHIDVIEQSDAKQIKNLKKIAAYAETN